MFLLNTTILWKTFDCCERTHLVLALHFLSICLVTVLAYNWNRDFCLTDVGELFNWDVCLSALVELTPTDVTSLRSLATLSVLH